MQSAYKQHHSTETAWVHLHNDNLSAMDDNKAVHWSPNTSAPYLTQLIVISFLHRLERRLGITGNCLSWSKSYLSERNFRVKIDEELSEPKDLKYGVPQGSVLGPKLFTSYMLPRHGVDFQLYADDSQLCIVFRKDSCLITVSKMELLINDMRSWMTRKKLKSNDDKSEIIVLNGALRPDINFPPLQSDTNQSLCQILLHLWEWNLTAT